MASPREVIPFRQRAAETAWEPTWHLKGFDLFRELPEAELELLQRGCRQQKLRRGAILYAAGDRAQTVYALRHGAIRLLALSAEGREGTLALLREGELFGETEALHGGGRSHFASAHEDSLVYALPAPLFRDVMARHPDFALKVMVRLGRRVEEIQSKILCLLFKSSHARLKELLLELGRYCGQPTPAGTRLRYRFSHHEMASLIGVARETVTLALRDFRREGLIANQGGHIVLRDPARLGATG